jgi:hypothetical protein
LIGLGDVSYKTKNNINGKKNPRKKPKRKLKKEREEDQKVTRTQKMIESYQ